MISYCFVTGKIKQLKRCKFCNKTSLWEGAYDKKLKETLWSIGCSHCKVPVIGKSLITFVDVQEIKS